MVTEKRVADCCGELSNGNIRRESVWTSLCKTHSCQMEPSLMNGPGNIVLGLCGKIRNIIPDPGTIFEMESSAGLKK